MMIGAATVLSVSDMTKSVEHYCNALGFAITYQYGKPIFYTCLCRDEVALHLISAQEANRPAGNGAVCIFVKDVDALHAELVSREAKIVKPPQDYDYGMRDFDVIDLDGNRLIFGTAFSQPTE